MRLNTKFVRHAMIERDIDDVAKLARRIGFSRQAMHVMIHGRSQPSVDTIGRLCRVLGCTPNDLLMEDEKQ